MFSGQEPKRIDVVLEYYRQASLNMRMFVDLRFKHFTTLMVISGILGAAAFNVPSTAPFRPFIQGLAFLITILFWLIDFRTSQYWKHELVKIQVFERALNEGTHLLMPPPDRVLLRSSAATNILFVVLSAGWLLSLFAGFIGIQAPAQQSSAANPLSSSGMQPASASAPVLPAARSTARPVGPASTASSKSRTP